MSKHIDVLLLLALPASGKSEARRYLASLSPEQCQEQFGIGHTVQLDDFPYVHIMRRVSDELTARGHPGAFFVSPALPFRNPVDWLTLIELMNEDYDDLVAGNKPAPESASLWLFDRIDAARVRAGGEAIIGTLPEDLRKRDRRPHRGRGPQAAERQGRRGARQPGGQDRGHRVRPRLRRRPDHAHPPPLRVRGQPGRS